MGGTALLLEKDCWLKGEVAKPESLLTSSAKAEVRWPPLEGAVRGRKTGDDLR